MTLVASCSDPVCGLGDGPPGTTTIAISAASGRLPTDLTLQVQVVGGSSNYTVRPADLPKNLDSGWCLLKGSDGGAATDDAAVGSGGESMFCSFALNADLQIHVRAAGFKTIDDTAQKKSKCKGDDLNVSYVLQPSN
jgi:hypothetical protein